MKVTRTRAKRVDEGSVVGYADVLLDDVLEINRIRIISGSMGLFASLPSWRRADGTWASLVTPRDEALRQEILDSVMKAYEEAE